jgi:hypothetical protein
MFYQSRFYDPALGRFTQADTIIPGGAQGLDRYAAMDNNPVRYNDPSGHDTECGLGQTGCTHKPKYTKPTTPTAPPIVVNIFVIGPYGVANAVSAQSTTPIDPNFLAPDQLNGQYPLQPIVDEYSGKYIIHPYDEISGQTTKEGVAESINGYIDNHPGEINILVTFSAGTVSGDTVYDTHPNDIAGFVALGTGGLEGEASFGDVDPNKFFHRNEADYGGINHFNLSVNDQVMADVINFINGILQTYGVTP